MIAVMTNTNVTKATSPLTEMANENLTHLDEALTRLECGHPKLYLCQHIDNTDRLRYYCGTCGTRIGKHTQNIRHHPSNTLIASADP